MKFLERVYDNKRISANTFNNSYYTAEGNTSGNNTDGEDLHESNIIETIDNNDTMDDLKVNLGKQDENGIPKFKLEENIIKIHNSNSFSKANPYKDKKATNTTLSSKKNLHNYTNATNIIIECSESSPRTNK